MPSASPLSVAFIERNPSAAARILENLAIDDAAALISVLPGYASASALGRMTPFAAAQCMAQLDTDQVAHLLRTMMFLDAASIREKVTPSVFADCETDLLSTERVDQLIAMVTSADD